MRVSDPPDNRTLLFDGTCGFCRAWVARLAESSPADTRPCQDARSDFPEISESDCLTAVRWIETDGTVHSGADAALRFWSSSSRPGRIAYWAYRTIPGVAPVSESLYRVVAASRPVASRLVKLLWGQHTLRPRFRISGDLFLRSLGLVYLFAFLSLLVQIKGLIGSAGILPVSETFQVVRSQLGASSYLTFPSLFWLWSTDTALILLCLAGCLSGIAGVLFPYVWVSWLASWSLYLSFVTVGRTFLSFQWDALLLEAGFLAILHTALHAHGWAAGTDRRPGVFSASPSLHRAVGWAYRWLLFRLMFGSGVVKLVSGDASWWNLTALTRHYETQPLPNVVAWYTHHLPAGFHTFSCAVMFVIELAVPFMFFAPRRARHLAAAATIGLQILIILTGNYTFFNLLTIALCFWLIEDTGWPIGLRERFGQPLIQRGANALRRAIVPAVCLNLALSSLLLARGTFRLDVTFPSVFSDLYGWVAPYRILNTYGLFSVMTTKRPEIIVEGSADGTHWEPYAFYYKPGDVGRRPPFVAPHQPRLDWQMWFAALGPIRSSPWFYHFAQRLFDGSEPVKKLLAIDPFPDVPPRYLRAHVFDYRFTSPSERAETGDWWTRSFSHVFLPPIVRRQP